MSRERTDTAQRLLDLARTRADVAEVIYQENEGRSVRFQDNKLKSVSTKSVCGVGLRVIHNGRLGFSCTNDLDSIEQVVSHALDSAAFGQKAKCEFPANQADVQVKLYDSDAAGLGMERAAQMVREGIAHVLEAFPETHCGGGIARSIGHLVLCNTNGLFCEQEFTGFDMGLGAFLIRGESFLSTDEGESSCRFSDDILRHARKVVEWIRLSEREAAVSGEHMPVMFTPKALDILLGSLEANTNGKSVQKGVSILSGRLGERVLDERITLWDDPLVDYATGSYDFDSEGTPARRKAIFENGTLKSFIYDLQTAGIMGTDSTGNAARGYSSSPHPAYANVRVAPGNTPYREMLSGIKRGLLIDEALGAGQSNVLAGEFSVNVELGFLVENGEIVGRVKNCMLAGNVFDAFNRIRDISAETEWHGSAELPAICFESLSVAGREG